MVTRLDLPTPDVRARAFVELEWPELLDRIASRCTSTEASARLRALSPAESLDEAIRRMRRTGDAIELDENGEPIPARSVPELSALLARTRIGASLGAIELRDVRRMLETARGLRAFAAARRESYPELAAVLDSAAELEKLLASLTLAIGDDGSVLDSASPELERARARHSETRAELVGRLSQLLRRHSDLLRDQYYTERDGRYVLPVRADAHMRVPGIVLGSSASGATLYVEPHEATELGNRLKVAEAAVEREIARVLAALSSEAASHAAELAQAYEACLQADVLQAIAAFARDTRARALIPDAEPRIDLKAFRHPLLAISGGAVVANDLFIRSGTALVVSGPNAGGKTVALKALGLAAWMARSGLPLPVARDSNVGWFSPVLADIGDDQSILRSLSTFSAHIVKLRAILAEAGPQALVLLDEVAAGTDPEEGSALARAIVEAILASGAAVVLTTHYERLKEVAAHDPRFVNASVGLKPDTLEPTFKVTSGVPGPSSALTVAERFGIPTDVVERARVLIPEESQAREALVHNLVQERARLEAARESAERDARVQAELLEQLQREREHVRQREREKLAQEARELLGAVRVARSQLREASARLRHEQVSREELKRLEQTVNEAARYVAIGGSLTKVVTGQSDEKPAPVPAHEALAVGTRVRVPHLGAEGMIVEPPNARGQVRLQVGPMRLTLQLDQLSVPGKSGKRVEEPKTRRAPPVVTDRTPVRTEATTLDLRGARVDEALEAVDAFIDRLLQEGEPAGFVLHGHGTGALKTAVREHLSRSSHVGTARPAERDEGGDAFTLFWLR